MNRAYAFASYSALSLASPGPMGQGVTYPGPQPSGGRGCQPQRERQQSAPDKTAKDDYRRKHIGGNLFGSIQSAQSWPVSGDHQIMQSGSLIGALAIFTLGIVIVVVGLGYLRSLKSPRNKDAAANLMGDGSSAHTAVRGGSTPDHLKQAPETGRNVS